MKSKKLWILGEDLPSCSIPLVQKKITSLSSLPETAPYAVVISYKTPEERLNILKALRSIPNYRHVPVFTNALLTAEECQLFDGLVEESLISKVEGIHKRLHMASTPNVHLTEKEQVFLVYLFSRGEIWFGGNVDYRARYLYVYPLLNLLFPEDPDMDGWHFLTDLVNRDLLITGAIRDEIKVCSSCDSGLLNFRSTCPHCHSIHIKEQRFVHCYRCGKIGPVADFLREERLICGRCNTPLIELGVDYEKPREDKTCLDCEHYFERPEMHVVCLFCHRIARQTELGSRGLYEYSLSRRGEGLVCGNDKGIYQDFNQFFKVIDYDAFMSIVLWQLKLAERYTSIYFSVVTLQVRNEREMLDLHGVVGMESLLGELFVDLRQVFRESDISSRKDGSMLFFLPMADTQGCEILSERIHVSVNTLSRKHDNKGLIIGLSYMNSKEMLNANLHALNLVQELHARIADSHLLLMGLG